MKHIDEWLDTPSFDVNENYAKFVIDYFRLPAWKHNAYERWMMVFELFCTYEDKRYRCTGASRLGDVWLAKDFHQVNGYDLRVDVDKCSNWGGAA